MKINFITGLVWPIFGGCTLLKLDFFESAAYLFYLNFRFTMQFVFEL